MTEREESERAILLQVKKMLGYEPIGMGDLLKVLTHPDLIRQTLCYVKRIEEGEI